MPSKKQTNTSTHSEIDDFLPEAAERHRKVMEQYQEEGLRLQRTKYPDAPPRAMAVLDKFHDLWAAEVGQEPSKKYMKMWVASAEDWLLEHGDNVQLLQRAFERMVKKDLNIKSLRSLIDEGYKIKRQGNPEDRSKYLKGLEDE